jgi:hypothetical protein
MPGAILFHSIGMETGFKARIQQSEVPGIRAPGPPVGGRAGSDADPFPLQHRGFVQCVGFRPVKTGIFAANMSDEATMSLL